MGILRFLLGQKNGEILFLKNNIWNRYFIKNWLSAFYHKKYRFELFLKIEWNFIDFFTLFLTFIKNFRIVILIKTYHNQLIINDFKLI